MKQRELVIRATKIDSRSGRTKTYPDRQGEVCAAQLSAYNPSRKAPHRCWLHRLHTKIRTRGVA